MTKLYYELEGKGPSLVLIPGYCSDLSIWELVRAKLAQQFSLVLLENRCSGRSLCPEEPCTIEAMAADTMELINSLGLKRPHVLGHSMGGAITQVLARDHSDQIGKAVLLQSAVQPHQVGIACLHAGQELVRAGVAPRLRAQVVMPWLFGNAFLAIPQAVEAFLGGIEHSPQQPTYEQMVQQYDALLQFNSLPWASKIKAPAMVLYADQDLLCPQAHQIELAQRIPGAHSHCFKGVGHCAQVEQPEEFIRVVSEFLLS
jgi:3-oxoadipate enol-lactonase